MKQYVPVVERSPEAVLPSRPGQVNDKSETPAGGADHRIVIVPINADYRFRRAVVGRNSNTVILPVEKRKIRHGVTDWVFVANDRSPMRLGNWLEGRGTYPDEENSAALAALAELRSQWRRPPFAGSAADAGKTPLLLAFPFPDFRRRVVIRHSLDSVPGGNRLLKRSITHR